MVICEIQQSMLWWPNTLLYHNHGSLHHYSILIFRMRPIIWRVSKDDYCDSALSCMCSSDRHFFLLTSISPFCRIYTLHPFLLSVHTLSIASINPFLYLSCAAISPRPGTCIPSFISLYGSITVFLIQKWHSFEQCFLQFISACLVLLCEWFSFIILLSVLQVHWRKIQCHLDSLVFSLMLDISVWNYRL